MRPLVDYAVRYAEALGHAVFPLRPGAKEPRTEHGFKDATTDKGAILNWWHAVPLSNIGLPVPPGFVVLDVDSEEALQALKHQDLEIPATVTARTPRGWHFWFRCDAELQPKVGIIEGVDLRAPGSYVVVPPSRLTDGRRYEWQVPPRADQYADVPSWIVEFGRHKPFLVAEEQGGVKPAEVLAGVGEGFRDVTLFRYACRLRALGYDRTEADVLVAHAAAACLPPVSSLTAAKKVESAWKYEGPKTAPEESKVWALPELLETEFPEPQWVIRELLPEGLAIVFSPAKVGKSFLLGAACAAVANGLIFIRGFLTAGAGVLYLDLEQGEAMAQARWLSILGSKPRPERLRTAFRWPRMDRGGLGKLDEFLTIHPDVRLVVVDVLAMFWPERGKSGDNAYIWEYRVLSQIRELAQRHAVAVMLVHHTNRSTPKDPLDRANGTQAMTGVPETIWVLSRQRNSDAGELYVTGRYVQEQTLEMRFDAGCGGWCLLNPRYHAHAEFYEATGAGSELDVLGGVEQ